MPDPQHAFSVAHLFHFSLPVVLPAVLCRFVHRSLDNDRECSCGGREGYLFVLTMVVHDLLCPNVRELTYSLSNRKIENPEANAPGFCHALIS